MWSRIRAALGTERLGKEATKSANRVADVGKDVVSKATALGRGVVNKTAEKVTETAANAVKHTEDATKIAAKKVSETATGYVASSRAAATRTADDAARSASNAIRKTENVVKEYVSSKRTEMRNIAEDSSRMTMKYATGAAASAKESTAKSLTSAGQSVVVAATVAKEATASGAGTVARGSFQATRAFAEEKKQRVTRWLWWWSLAAVGVYGLATSVPREMRLALESRYKKDEGKELSADEKYSEAGGSGEGQAHPDFIKAITSFIWR